jgi:hypothetical protein
MKYLKAVLSRTFGLRIAARVVIHLRNLLISPGRV